MRVAVDTREPCPHPWERFLPEGWHFERGTLETDDIALAVLPDGAVVERKRDPIFWGLRLNTIPFPTLPATPVHRRVHVHFSGFKLAMRLLTRSRGTRDGPYAVPMSTCPSSNSHSMP